MSAPTRGSCVCPLSPTLSGRSYLVNVHFKTVQTFI